MSPTSHPCQTEGRDDLAAGVGVPAEALLAMFQTSGLTAWVRKNILTSFNPLQSTTQAISLYVVRVQNYSSLQNMYIYDIHYI